MTGILLDTTAIHLKAQRDFIYPTFSSPDFISALVFTLKCNNRLGEATGSFYFYKSAKSLTRISQADGAEVISVSLWTQLLTWNMNMVAGIRQFLTCKSSGESYGGHIIISFVNDICIANNSENARQK